MNDDLEKQFDIYMSAKDNQVSSNSQKDLVLKEAEVKVKNLFKENIKNVIETVFEKYSENCKERKLNVNYSVESWMGVSLFCLEADSSDNLMRALDEYPTLMISFDQHHIKYDWFKDYEGYLQTGGEPVCCVSSYRIEKRALKGIKVGGKKLVDWLTFSNEYVYRKHKWGFWEISKINESFLSEILEAFILAYLKQIS
ncbi:MAG: hypothetical protein HQL29_01835 [Candidatus Omnitrophica bacterium]|nr:hypothetical protein [Candidatus Omnitrophota bacterium]